ncbi:hypothetical protein ACLOJK_014160 [Asimina triloba]
MTGIGFMSWINRKIVDPLMQIFRKGLEPKLLAFSGALGMTLGLFPVCGVTVLLCGLAIGLLGDRCHAPTVMLTNFVATPIELSVLASLVVPFLRFGEAISGGEHFPLNTDAMKKVVTGQASREVLLSIFHAVFLNLVKSVAMGVGTCGNLNHLDSRLYVNISTTEVPGPTPIKPEEATPFPFGNQAQGKGCLRPAPIMEDLAV